MSGCATELAVPANDEGVAGLADFDGGNLFGDRIEVDLRDRHPGPGMGDGDRHGWLRAVAKVDRAEPGPGFHGLGEARLGGMVRQAGDGIRPEPRNLQLFDAFAVEIEQFGDCRHLAKQAGEIIALLIDPDALPLGPRGPAELALQIGYEAAYPPGGSLGLVPLHFERCVTRFPVAGPKAERAIGQQHQSHKSSHGGSELHGQRNAHAAARLSARILRRAGGDHVRPLSLRG